MKRIITLALLSQLALTAPAQSIATKVSYNKAEQPALVLELPHNQDVAEGFIVENLKKIGYEPQTQGNLFWKKEKINGYYQFKGVQIDSNSSQKIDLYFKVEPKSKKQKDKSIIYFLASKGDEPKFISYESDEKMFQASKKFLNSFVEGSAHYKLELDIRNQEEALRTAENKLKKLQDEEVSLNKKIENLQKDLKEVKQKQEQQSGAIENEKQLLEKLKAQKTV